MANDVRLIAELGLNSKKAERQIEEIKKKVSREKLNLDFKIDSNSIKEVSNALDKINEKSKTVNGKVFENWSKNLKVAQTETYKWVDAQKSLHTVITKTTEDGNVYQTRLKQTADELGNVTTKTQNYIRVSGQLQKAGEALTSVEQGTTKAKAAIKEITKEETEAAKAAEKLAKEQERLAQVAEKESLKKAKEEAKQLAEAEKQAAIEAEKLRTTQENIDKEMLLAKARYELNTNSLAGMSLKIADATKKVALFAMSTALIGVFTAAMTEAVKVVKEFDDALTDFKKVSDLNGDALDRYTAKLGELGETVARTRTEMVESAQNFVRSGYTEDEAARLSQIAELFRNVADAEISSQEAAGFVISQMKAYGDNTEAFAQHVVDSINNISNNMAVSSSDIQSGLSKTASAMATAGNTFDESAALVSAGVETMYNQSNKVSRGLRTISANLSKMATSTGELKYTVNGVEKSISLMDETTGDMLNTFQIFQQIYTNGWQQMSNAEKETLAIQIANKNQLEVATAVLNNFEGAQKAVDLAIESQNSAWEENSRYMESISAKLAKIKTAFDNLVLGDGGLSKFVKLVLDATAGLIEFANTDFGGLIIAIGLTTVAMIALNTQFAKLTGMQLSNLIGGIAESLIFATECIADAKIGLTGLMSMLELNPIILALTAVVAIGTVVVKTIQYQSEAVERLAENVSNLISETEKLENEYKTLSSKSDLTESERTRLELLKAEIEANKQLIQQEYEKQTAEQERRDKRRGIRTQHQTYGDENKKYVTEASALDIDAEKNSVENLVKAYEILENTKAESLEQDNKIQKKKAEIISTLTAEGVALLDYKEKGIELSQYDEYRLGLIQQIIDLNKDEADSETEKADNLEEVADKYGYTAEQMEEYLDSNSALAEQLENGEANWEDVGNAMKNAGIVAEDIDESLQNLSSDIKTLATDYESLQSAVEDYNNGGTISLETLDALINAATNYSGCLDFQNGKLVLAEGYFEALAEQKIANAKADLVMETQSRLAALAEEEVGNATQSTGSTIDVTKTSVDDMCESLRNMSGEAITAAQAWSVLGKTMGGGYDLSKDKKRDDIRKEFTAQWETLDQLGKQVSTNFSGYSKSMAKSSKGSAKESKDAWIEAYKAEKDTLDSLYKTSVITAEEYATKLRELSDKYLTDTAEHQKKYAKEIHDAYEAMYTALKKAAKEALDDEADRLKKQLDALKDEKTARLKEVKRSHEEEEKAIKKKIEALKREKDTVKASYDAKIKALKDEREEYERQVKLMKLKEELAKAKATKQYVMDETGKFTYREDSTAVDEAQENLIEEELKQQYEHELEILEKARDDADDIYEQRIQALEDYYDEVKERNDKAEQDLEDYYDRLIAQREKAYNDFKDNAEKWLNGQAQLTNAENTEWGRRLQNLANFVNEYNRLMNSLNNGSTGNSSGYSGQSSSGGKISGGGSKSSSTQKAIGTAAKIGVATATKKIGSVISKITSRHADGADSIDSNEIALVGDSPNKELVIGSKLNGVPLSLSRGSGVVNAQSTKSLAGLINMLGGLNPSFAANQTTANQTSNITISNVSLPNVKNGEEFIDYLQHFDVDMMQRGYDTV